MKAFAMLTVAALVVSWGACTEQPVFVELSNLPGTYEGSRRDHSDRLELISDGTYRYTSSYLGISKVTSGRWQADNFTNGTRVQTWGACFEWGEFKLVDCEKADPNLGWAMPVRTNKNGIFLMIDPDSKLYFRKVSEGER